MTGTSEKTSLGVPNLLESKLALPKLRVFKVLIFNNCYADLIPSHDPSQNLGVDTKTGLLSPGQGITPDPVGFHPGLTML